MTFPSSTNYQHETISSQQQRHTLYRLLVTLRRLDCYKSTSAYSLAFGASHGEPGFFFFAPK